MEINTNGSPPQTVQLSRETLELLAELLERTTIAVNQPEFEQAAIRVIVAKRELAAALEEPV